MKGGIELEDDSEAAVKVDVFGANAWGHHSTGTVKVILPTGE
jgi:hypothetical protein